MNPGAAQSRASGRSPDCGIRKNTSTKKSGFFVFQSVSNCFKVLQFPAFLTTPARNPHNRVYDLERRAILPLNEKNEPRMAANKIDS
jgi:hypothetical protein